MVYSTKDYFKLAWPSGNRCHWQINQLLLKALQYCFLHDNSVLTSVFSILFQLTASSAILALNLAKNLKKIPFAQRLNEAQYVMTCPSGLDTCQRVHGTALDVHAVTMSCTTKSACEEAKKKCEDSGDDCGVACCTTDKCNAGSSVSFSVLFMGVSSLLNLALLK